MRIQRLLVVSVATLISFAIADAQAARGDKAGRGGGGATSRPARDPAVVFKKVDTDADGKVSKAEFDAFVAKAAERREGRGKGGKEGKNGGAMDKGDAVFAKLDADQDGSLTPEEFAKFAELRKERAGGKRAKPNV